MEGTQRGQRSVVAGKDKYLIAARKGCPWLDATLWPAYFYNIQFNFVNVKSSRPANNAAGEIEWELLFPQMGFCLLCMRISDRDLNASRFGLPGG